MKIQALLFHPFGNNNVRQAAMTLAEMQMLEEFWIGFSWDGSHWLNNYLPKKITRELCRRSYPPIVLNKTHNYPLLELTRLMVYRSNLIKIKKLQDMAGDMIGKCRDYLDQKVATRVERHQFNCVYGYDEASLHTFAAAKLKNIKCIYELSAAHPAYVKNIYERELERFPIWGQGQKKPLIWGRQSRVDEEISYADAIVVASSYTRSTLYGHVDERIPIFVNPYGTPPLMSLCATGTAKHASKKLRVLYVGSISIMKGIHYLLEAVHALGDKVELTLVGMPVDVPGIVIQELERHTWIQTLPNTEVLELMTRHDVFVFPSLSDGFGLVVLEALSRGLPVIASINSGGADVIIDGENGFVVPICSTIEIVSKLELLHHNRELLEDMSQNALLTAAEWNWSRYRCRLVEIIQATMRAKR